MRELLDGCGRWVRATWPGILVITASGVTFAVWKYAFHATRDANMVIALSSLVASILAAVFSFQAAMVQNRNADVWLRVTPKPAKRARLTLARSDKGDFTLSLALVNKGTETIDKAYVKVEVPTATLKTVSYHHQPPRGMIQVVHPDLDVSPENTSIAEGWVKQEMWPGADMNMGQANEIHISPDAPDELVMKWTVHTKHGTRTGDVMLHLEHGAKLGSE